MSCRKRPCHGPAGLDCPDIPVTISTEIDIPEHIAHCAEMIAERSSDPEKDVGDFLDSVCLLEITFTVDGDPINVVSDNY